MTKTQSGRMMNHTGQAIVEYLAIALAVIAALMMIAGPINTMTHDLAKKTDYQLRNASGRADFLFQ